jgi:hypothetical protein
MQFVNLNVGNAASQNGTLTLQGPGTFVSTGSSNSYASGFVDVGNNGGTGQLILNDMTLQQEGDVVNGSIAANGLTVENGAEIQMIFGNSATISNATFNDGTIRGGNSVTVNGLTGTNDSLVYAENVTLSNANLSSGAGVGADTLLTVSGTNTVSDGGGFGAPAMSVSGTTSILPGGSALSGDLTMNNGTFAIELNASVSDPISRPATTDNGTLDFTLQSGFEPVIGEHFTIFKAAQESGTYANVNLPALPGSESWDTSDLYTTGVITVVPEPVSAGLILFGIAGMSLRRRR